MAENEVPVGNGGSCACCQGGGHQWRPLVVVLALLVLGPVLLTVGYKMTKARAGADPLVVYCSHDMEYSDAVIKNFTEKTGIPVIPKYDTESTKSLGLVQLIVSEAANPRCDVFWNNEMLGMMDLKSKGLLESYKGPGYDRMPDKFKDVDGCWTGFGARMRIVIVNTEKCGDIDEAAAAARFEADDLSRVAVAKPLYGTTLTHYSCLWRELGADGLKKLHQERIDRKINILNGNGAVKNAVADGVCDIGWTDTDDFFVAKNAGKPVKMFPARLGDGSTVCIPNTVGIIKGTKRMDKAKAFVEFILSEESEIALAKSDAKQIPLGPVADENSIPEDVRALRQFAAQGAPLEGLLEMRSACIDWLNSGK